MTRQLTPGDNLACQYHFTCAARTCPPGGREDGCYVNRFNRYQPAWHERNWEDLKNVTWHDVFSLKEKLIYTLILIVIIVFMFFLAILIKIVVGL